MKRNEIPRAGVLTTRNYIYTPQGEQMRAFYNEEWLIVTDKEADLAGIKTADKWSAVAYVDGKVAMIVLGCEVIGFAPCTEPPPLNSCYYIK